MGDGPVPLIWIIITRLYGFRVLGGPAHSVGAHRGHGDHIPATAGTSTGATSPWSAHEVPRLMDIMFWYGGHAQRSRRATTNGTWSATRTRGCWPPGRFCGRLASAEHPHPIAPATPSARPGTHRPDEHATSRWVVGEMSRLAAPRRAAAGHRGLRDPELPAPGAESPCEGSRWTSSGAGGETADRQCRSASWTPVTVGGRPGNGSASR